MYASCQRTKNQFLDTGVQKREMESTEQAWNIFLIFKPEKKATLK
jgi:hypothetical protein